MAEAKRPRGKSARPSDKRKAAGSGRANADERLARRLLVGGGLSLLPGIALVALGPNDLGILLCVGGLLGVIAGIHTYGRLGAPAPT